MAVTVGLFIVSLAQVVTTLQASLPNSFWPIVSFIGWVIVLIGTGLVILEGGRSRFARQA